MRLFSYWKLLCDLYKEDQSHARETKSTGREDRVPKNRGPEDVAVLHLAFMNRNTTTGNVCQCSKLILRLCCCES